MYFEESLFQTNNDVKFLYTYHASVVLLNTIFFLILFLYVSLSCSLQS